MNDTDKYEETDHPELVEFEGETLGDTLTNLLAEVKRLREENNRYEDFIFWLGIEHKGKKLAWEYGDEKLAEML
jgi:hypothetical protein